MRRRELDVHRERGRVPAQPLRADAELVHRAREALLELRAFGIVAAGAERARRGDLGEMHAQVGGAAHADTDDGRRAGLAAGVQHAIDHEGLDRVHALGRHRHPEPRVVLRARALGDHLDRQRFAILREIHVHHRYLPPAGGVLVLARDGVNDGRAQRMLARRALAALGDRLLERVAVDLDAGAYGDVVDRDAGVLAQQVVGLLGDLDIPDHGAEDRLPGGVGLALIEAREPLLDIGRQDLEGADVELLRGLFHLLQVYFHRGSVDDFQLASLYDLGPARRFIAYRFRELGGRIAHRRHAEIVEALAKVRRLQRLGGVAVDLVDHRRGRPGRRHQPEPAEVLKAGQGFRDGGHVLQLRRASLAG